MEKNEKSFEENLENLEKIVKDLENGDETVTKVLNSDGDLENFKVEE